MFKNEIDQNERPWKMKTWNYWTSSRGIRRISCKTFKKNYTGTNINIYANAYICASILIYAHIYTCIINLKVSKWW